MNNDFPRLLTLLRKEKGVSQKKAAEHLQVSQALLSHYEKGIRECGLEFLVRCADYYNVSCDYLLGRSPDRRGATLTADDIPESDAAGRGNTRYKTVLPVLNKKLLANSHEILFDLLAKTENKSLITEVSAYLMLAFYRMFMLVYFVNPKNQRAMFTLPLQASLGYSAAAMDVCEANAASIASGSPLPGLDSVKEPEKLTVSTESLGLDYPLFSPSIANLIQNAEKRFLPYGKTKQ